MDGGNAPHSQVKRASGGGTPAAYAAGMRASFRFDLGHDVLVLALGILASTAACGGTTDEPASAGSPSPGPSTSEPVTTSGGSSIEFFHHGSANLGVDHQRRVFSIVAHAQGSDAFANVCGALPVSGDAVGPGAELKLPSGLLFPTATGGGVAVSTVSVVSVDSSALVLHLVLKNGSSYDERWLRGLGTECAGDCNPPLTTCRATP